MACHAVGTSSILVETANKYRFNNMSKIDDTIKKAYANIPKDVVLVIFDWLPTFRGIKYYWLLLKRKFTR